MLCKSSQLIKKRSFNDKKWSIAFETQSNNPTYELGETGIDWADTTTYLVLSRNLKFDQNVALKKDKASKTLGPINHILKQVPQ